MRAEGAIAGAVHGEPQLGAVGVDRGEGLADLLLVGDVRGEQPDALGQLPGGGHGLVQVETVDRGAPGGERRGGGGAETGSGTGDESGGAA